MAENRQVQILVAGEEDLLTLAAVWLAPLGSLVVYGQPHQGVVTVEVTAQKKREAEKIFGLMEKVEE